MRNRQAQFFNQGVVGGGVAPLPHPPTAAAAAAGDAWHPLGEEQQPAAGTEQAPVAAATPVNEERVEGVEASGAAAGQGEEAGIEAEEAAQRTDTED